MRPIVRFYESEQHARAAAAKLLEVGIAEKNVHVMTPPAAAPAPAPEGEGAPAPAPASGEQATSAFMAGFALGDALGDREKAGLCAEALGRGRSVLVAEVHFGLGETANTIVDSHHPVDTELLVPPEASPAYVDEPGAPLSSAFKWPILLDNAAPFSEFTGFPILSEGRTWLSRVFPSLTRSSFTFSSIFGLGMLSDNPAPLSSRLGWKLLASNANPWESSFGMKLLSPNPTPLSSAIGIKTLLRREGPWTKSFGFPLLLDDRR